MVEVAKVVKEDGKYAVIRIDKKDECSKCGMCLFPQCASFIESRVENPLGAKKDDEVMIETTEKGKLTGILLVFFVPLLLIGLSAFITYTFIKIDIWMLILSVILDVIWFVVLSIIDKSFQKTGKYSPRITNIILKNDDKNTQNTQEK